LGHRFCNWVMGLLRQASPVMQINGDMNEELPILRAVKHGCPLALLVYALATEPFVRGFLQMQREVVVEGIKKGRTELLMKMFANDTILLLKAKECKVKRA